MERSDFQSQREEMVANQIKRRGIRNPALLAAMESVPRHQFVPGALQPLSYQDHPLAIGQGQMISQPYIVALMTDLLGVQPKLKVLEIGTGSGYQAAILAHLGVRLWSVERIPELAERAHAILVQLGYPITLCVGDGSLGWQKYAPYDKIVVTAATPAISPCWLEQLAVGGVIVVPVGGIHHQELTVVKKVDQRNVESTVVCGCVFVPLKGVHGYD